MVHIMDKDSDSLGYFNRRALSIGGRFDVFKEDQTKLAEVKGNCTGWNFKMTDNEGKELFTNSNNYMISLSNTLEGNQKVVPLLLMAGLAIDVVYGERQ